MAYNKTIDPGLGYRLVREDEQVRPGDEFHTDPNIWVTSACLPSSSFTPSVPDNTYRRKIDVGAGYRQLSIDEKVEHGDEYWYPEEDRWAETMEPGITPRQRGLTYRRKQSESSQNYFTGAMEYGYRKLENGEPVQSGDEFWNPYRERWQDGGHCAPQPVGTCEGHLWNTKLTFRRKVAPGEGYVLVPKGALLQHGDEILVDNGRWEEYKYPSEHETNLGVTLFRRVDVGEGYEVIPKGAALQPGDEWKPSGQWVRYGDPLKGEVNHGYYPFRRKVAKPQPDFPDGYRKLREGETLLLTDEVWCSGRNKWVPTDAAGHEIGTGWTAGLTYRRKLSTEPVGEGYRELHSFETVREGDELLAGDGIWTRALAVNQLCIQGVRYRRKLEPTIAEPVTPTGDPGEGYKLLEPGTRVLEGDEFFSREALKWTLTTRGGLKVVGSEKDDLQYRRKVPVPAPTYYRLLNPDEKIESGDALWNDVWEEWNEVDCEDVDNLAGEFEQPIRRTLPAGTIV